MHGVSPKRPEAEAAEAVEALEAVSENARTHEVPECKMGGIFKWSADEFPIYIIYIYIYCIYT